MVLEGAIVVFAVGAYLLFTRNERVTDFTLRHSGRIVAAVIVAVAVARGWYDVVQGNGLGQSSALYLGVPVLMAIVLATMAPATSCLRLTLVAVGAGLVVALIVLREAWFCVAMAAPFMLGAGAIVAGLVDVARRHGGTGAAALTFVPFALMGLEGTHPALDLPRHEVVSAMAVVGASPGAVEAALAAPARFDRDLPRFLSLGFPQPLSGSGSDLRPGDSYTVEFAGGGKLVLEVVSHRAGLIVFRPVVHTTAAAGWLDLTEARVRWSPESGGRTQVTWSIAYDRKLDPAAYFGPLERVAMRQAASYLIAAVATP